MRKLKLSLGAENSPADTDPVFSVWLEIPWSELGDRPRRLVVLRCGLTHSKADAFWDEVAPLFNLTDSL